MQLRGQALGPSGTGNQTLPLALRAAVAAVASWLAVMPMGGLADDYPYYAPLGAVVAVSTTVSASIRSAVQSFLALGTGACLGVGLHATPVPTPIGIGLVVALGTALGTARWFGSMGSWVPITALFVLVLGHDSAWHFGLGYLALTGFGALVGVAVSLALPPLQLAETARAQDRLRDALVEQLDELADGLRSQPLPTAEQWRARRRDMEPKARVVRDLVAGATGGPAVNWRLRRWRQRADELSSQGLALANLAYQIGGLADLIGDREQAQRAQVPLGPQLRPAAATALRDTAAALRTVQGRAAEPRPLADALRSVNGLRDAIRERRRRTGEDLFVAGTLVTSLRSELLSVKPLARTADRG